MDRRTRNKHSLFAPFITGEIHPKRQDAAQRLIHQWGRRTGEFASLQWSDNQICDMINIDMESDTGFIAMLNKVLELRNGRGQLPA